MLSAVTTIACRVLHSDTAEHGSTMRSQFNSLAVDSGLENNTRMGTNSSISDGSTDALGLA